MTLHEEQLRFGPTLWNPKWEGLRAAYTGQYYCEMTGSRIPIIRTLRRLVAKVLESCKANLGVSDSYGTALELDLVGPKFSYKCI